MELRCFGKNKKRTWYMGRALNGADYISLAVIIVFCITALIITFWDGSRFWNPFL